MNSGAPPPDPDGGQRIDKWLWHARMTRSRTLAQKLVESGSVRINRDRVRSASRAVRAGDVLTLTIGPHVRVVRILALSERRLGAQAALGLFEDLGRPVAPDPSREAGPPP